MTKPYGTAQTMSRSRDRLSNRCDECVVVIHGRSAFGADAFDSGLDGLQAAVSMAREQHTGHLWRAWLGVPKMMRTSRLTVASLTSNRSATARCIPGTSTLVCMATRQHRMSACQSLALPLRRPVPCHYFGVLLLASCGGWVCHRSARHLIQPGDSTDRTPDLHKVALWKLAGSSARGRGHVALARARTVPHPTGDLGHHSTGPSAESVDI
jgi:hypothetical protein